MKALSLTQPWASLMSWDEKRFETRGWSTSYRGELAIAASKSFPGECRALCQWEHFREVLREHGDPIVSVKASGPTSLPLAKIVCVVDVVDCIPTMPDSASRRLARATSVQPAKHELHFGDYTPERFVFITRNVRRLASPVPTECIVKGAPKAGGALGIYDLSPACEAAVRAQLVQGAA